MREADRTETKQKQQRVCTKNGRDNASNVGFSGFINHNVISIGFTSSNQSTKIYSGPWIGRLDSFFKYFVRTAPHRHTH